MNRILYIGIFFLLSAIFTLWMPNALWLVPVYTACILFMRRETCFSDNGKTAFRILMIACGLRVALVLLYGSYCAMMKTPDIIGDAAAFTSYGLYITEILIGKRMFFLKIVELMWKGYAGYIPDMGTYQLSGLAYLQAAIYSVTGYSVFTMKLINSLVAVITGFLVYQFLRKRVSPGVSIAAMSAVVFWPSALIWSLTGLKEPFIMLITLCILFSFTYLLCSKPAIRKMAVIAAFIFVLSVYAGTLRTRINYIYWITIGLSLCILWLARLKRKARKVVIISVIAAVLATSLTPILKPKIARGIYTMITYQAIQSSVRARTSYKIYPGRIYDERLPILIAVMRSEPLSLPEWSAAIFKGMSYFAFAPFFYHVKMSKMLGIFYPLSLLTLFLFPFMIAGSRKALGEQPESFLPLFIFMLVYWFTAGMTAGNIGTALRHRDLMMPAYLIFAVIGMYDIFGRRRA